MSKIPIESLSNNHKNLKIISLTMQNWKCFTFKNINFTPLNNFFDQENGFGKTTIIQAIIFCIYGKLPANAKIVNLQKDKSESIKFSLDFMCDNISYTVERDISPKGVKTCRFKKTGEDFSEYSVNNMNALLSKFFGDLKYMDVIWSQYPLIYSNILKTEFVTNMISDLLKDEREYSTYLKSQIFALNKEKKKIEEALKTFNANEENIDEYIEKANKIKEAITERLKNKSKSSTDSAAKSAAERCLAAKNRRSEIKNNIGNIYSVKEISEYKTFYMNKDKNRKIIDRYSESVSEAVEKFRKFFNSSELSKMIKINSETGECPVCGHEFHFPFTEDDLKNFEGKEDFDRASFELKKLEEYDKEKIKLSVEYLSLEKDANIYENPEKIIEEFNDSVEQDFKDLEQANKTINQCEKCKEFYSSLKEINIDIANYQKLLEISKEYENEAINFYTMTIIMKATSILSNIDQKYISIMFDKNTSGYNICVIDENNASIETRPVESFSSGEKTIIALCLALAFKEVFAPNSILILDESLGTLDPAHLETCISILSSVPYQTIVVAHNRKN